MKNVFIFMSILSLITGLFVSGILTFPDESSVFSVPSVDAQETKALESCKFFRNDQQSADCPPSAQGFRCEQSLEFKSPLLLSYIKGASEKTKVPQEVLAAFVRVESTVPLKYSATKKSYSISDYTDEDVRQMKNPISSAGDIDATIGNTSKAFCPRSTTGALGIMQIQPPQQVHDVVRANIIENNKKRSVQYDVPAADQPDKSTPGNIDAAARAIGKTKGTLTVDDFCDPQKSLVMASHVFFGKMGMSSWNPPKDAAGYETFINELARLYYGNDAQTGAYGNSVWRSVSSCQGASFSGQAVTTTASAPTVSCPVPNGKISFNSYEGGKGHCGPGYGFDCNCGTKGRRAKAIDVKGGDPVLPQIEGESVNWTYLISYTVDGGEGGGKGHTFRAKKGADSWYLDILHLSNSPLTEGKEYPSGTKIGTIDGPHAHFTIGKNLKTDFPRAATESDCDPGWMPSEFACDGSTQPTTGTGGGSGTTTTVNSNKFCTKVGNPTEPNPCPVSTGPTGPFPYFCQSDPQWQKAGWACTLAGNGCGPTSLAMLFSYYGDTTTPPDQYESVQKGLFNCNQGTYMPSMLGGKTWFTDKGYEVGANIGAATLKMEEAKKAIDDGWLIVASTDYYKGLDIGHIFIIQDVDPAAGTFIMRDPANCNADGSERVTNNVQPVKGSTFITNWKYAYAVRKIGYTPAKKETTPVVSASGKAFPVSGWNLGVKLHWDVDKGGSDFPPEKPANPDQWVGTPVVAVEDSVVEEVNGPDYKGPGGNYVQLKGKASNLSYYYAHLKERSVEKGKEVKAGERIGSIGMSGNAPYPHLHLGVGPSISYGAGAQGGVGNFDAISMLCGILNKPLNEKGDCR